MSRKIKWLALGLSVALLVFTRFINLSWGLPYPFHPDERNIANAVQSLNCEMSVISYQLSDCFNPNFFAYGQFPIYLSYIFIFLSRLVTKISGAVRFEEAVMALRFISATASLSTVYFSHKILKQFIPNTRYLLLYTLPLVFSPALIQFAHFGTTESLLMLFFSLLIYLCLKLKDLKSSENIDSLYIWIGVVTGLAVATKVSSLLFAIIPFFAITSLHRKQANESKYQSFWQWFNELVFIGFVVGATAVIFSPHNLISWSDFIGSIEYESTVATGTSQVFYTRTFTESVPVLFQFQRIFPYALGLPVVAAFLISFFTLPNTWKYNLLRFSFLGFFIPWAFFYAKWTRFVAPVFPLMIVMAVLFVSRLPKRLGYAVCLALVIPGIMFLKVYTTQDVRFQASEWMMKNVPNNSYILQETANVVDLPVFDRTFNLEHRTFKNISFNFYELDSDKKLQAELKGHLKKADYIIVPTRRIFMNHPANRYPVLGRYYEELFSGKLGFEKVAEFGILDDEDAEETWTVFDHPVIRIYKRSKY